jgi:hypothetical protein
MGISHHLRRPIDLPKLLSSGSGISQVTLVVSNRRQLRQSEGDPHQAVSFLEYSLEEVKRRRRPALDVGSVQQHHRILVYLGLRFGRRHAFDIQYLAGDLLGAARSESADPRQAGDGGASLFHHSGQCGPGLGLRTASAAPSTARKSTPAWRTTTCTFTTSAEPLRPGSASPACPCASSPEIMGWEEEYVEKIIRRYVGRNAGGH